MTEANKEANSEAQKRFEIQPVMYTDYFTQFVKFYVKLLMESDSKVNVMYSSLESKLAFCNSKINMGSQKIDGSKLKTYSIVIALCDDVLCLNISLITRLCFVNSHIMHTWSNDTYTN